MPFRLLDEQKQKKLSTAKLTLPILVFIVGLAITISLANTFHQSDLKFRHEGLTARTREFFKVQNLILNNSILRIQSFSELSTLMRSRSHIQKSVVKQIIASTMFTRASLFNYIGKNSSDGLPDLALKQRFIITEDNLPSNSKKMQSPFIRRKIKLMIEENLPNTVAVSTLNDTYSLSLIWRSNVSRNEYITFSTTVEDFFKDWPKELSLSAIVKDTQAGIEVLVQKKPDSGKLTLTTDPKEITEAKTNSKFTIYDHELINNNYGTSIEWIQNSEEKISKFVLMIICFGVLISLMTSLFLKFILDQNRRIYKLVISRTEQLEMALNQAQEANQAKTRFLANMSHELRTPLNLILGMIEILQLNTQDKKTFDYLKNMQTASEHLLNLITDLLSMSKEDVSDLKVNIAPINIPIFFEEIGFIIGPECRKKNLEFELHIAHEIPALLNGDPVKIRQILINLLRNSLKYTNSGKLTLNVDLVKRNVSTITTCHLRFEVKDTGVGIPKNKMNLIFDRFFQIEDSKMLAEGGVGLGLSIVKDLVSKMHGNITVKSELGVGSVFTVDLDLESREEQSWISQYQVVKSNISKIAIITDNPQQAIHISQLVPSNIFSVKSFTTDDLFAHQQGLETYDQYILQTIKPNAVLTLSSLIKDKKIILIASELNQDSLQQHSNLQFLDAVPILPSKLFEALNFKTTSKKRSSNTAEAEILQPVQQKSISILAVDDDAGNRELLKAYLSDPQYNVQFANDGKEAFMQFVNKRPDLVIADLRMPIMNGFELAEAIKNYETSNDKNAKITPIILLTADALENTSNEAKKYAISMFLTKPIRRTKLLNAIHETYKES